MLRPVQGSCGWEWAFEGKPNCFCTVGATESVSVNKAGMCWHITRGRGRSRQCWVAPQECKILPLLSQCTNVFWDRSVFYFLSRSKFVYDFCDTGMVCPLAKMYTLGSGFIPSPNHAGGLRYHGMSSILSQLYHDGLMEARSVEQTSVFEAAEQFARIEGILPAPESSHAIRAAIDEALKCKETGEEKTIVFGLTGTGYFDMVAYEKFHDGQMSDYIPTDADLQKGFDGIPRFPGNEI